MSGDIIKLVPKAKDAEPAIDPEIVATLEELLADAKTGKILGLIAITEVDEHYDYVRCGSAGVGNLTHAIGMVTGYQHRLCSKLG